MLSKAILILTIVNPSHQTTLDHELYEDEAHCFAVAEEITNYNKSFNEGKTDHGVVCKCVKL